jgi:uncharacterized protein (TIGR02246 family)
MKLLSIFALIFALILPGALLARDAESEITSVLTAQVDAWNRGDIPAFVMTYAEDCIFVTNATTPIAQGRDQLLARYQRKYPTPAAMGHLTFSNMAIHLLEKDVATLTAEWHLDRSAEAGGPVGGIFSLVLHRQNGAWKIALDHTS